MSVAIPKLLIKNSFNIFGLSSSATLKDVRQRAQQLLQLAKIEEVQEFETDIGNVSELRTKSEIKLALERISGIKERLSELFFWFDDHSIENLKAISLISLKNYQEAIDILEKTNKVDWLGQKNLALAYLFEAFSSSSLNNFGQSLELWKRIAESEDFWKFYEKHYLLYDELGTSPLLFQEFRSSIGGFLSDITAFFYHQTKKSEVIGTYYSTFGQIEKSIDDGIIQPLVLKIKKEIEKLEEIVSDQDFNTISIKQSLKKIHLHFLVLDKFKLSSYSPLTVLKNDSAEKLLSISIDINNDYDNFEAALLVVDQSAKLAVLDTIISRIYTNKKTFKNNQIWDEIFPRFDKIKDLVTNKEFEEAESEYLKWDTELVKNGDESSPNPIRVILLINFCKELMEKGNELFEEKKFGIEILAIDGFLNSQNHEEAILAFGLAAKISTNQICILNFKDPSNDKTELSKAISNMSDCLENCELSSLSDDNITHREIIEVIVNKQEDEWTKAGIMLLACSTAANINYRRHAEFLQGKMWKWILSCIIIVTLALGCNFDKSKTKSSPKKTYRTRSSYYTN